MKKKKNITIEKQTLKDYIKILLVDNGIGVRPQKDKDDIVAIYGVLNLNEFSKEVEKYIHKTPLNELFETDPYFSINSTFGFINSQK